MALKFRYEHEVGRFLEAMTAKDKPIANAATAAIVEVAGKVKEEARADIGRAGFSRKWQNALRVDVYPKNGKTSINAAAWVFHRIPYAGIFERGGPIVGQPILWVPLPTVFRYVGKKGSNRATPKRLIEEGVKLFKITSKSGKPLLAAKLNVGASVFAARKIRNVKLASLKAGTVGRAKSRVTATVPLFVGQSTVNMRKRFHITQIVNRAKSQLAAAYVANFKDQ